MKKLPIIIIALFIAAIAYAVMAEQCKSRQNIENNSKEDSSCSSSHSPSMDILQLYDDSCFEEKSMFETIYPKCPTDIDKEMYELMLVILEAQNLYVDMEHYWRYLDVIKMSEMDSADVGEDKKIASNYLKELTRLGNCYNAPQISSPKMKKISIQNIKESIKVLNTPENKLTDSYNVGTVIKAIKKRYQSTEAYKRLGVDNDCVDDYMERFFSRLKSSDDPVLKTILASKGTESEGTYIAVLKEIIDSGKYTEWLPMVWQRWRFLTGMHFGSPSKDGEIANWFYNESKIKCYNTILRHIKSHSEDKNARIAAVVLLEKANIQIFGEFPYGNQLIVEDYLYEPQEQETK